MLISLGITDLVHFDFMDPPPSETLIRALEQLYALGSLNDEGQLTKLGRRMAEFPVEPMLAKCILASEEFKCVDQILTACSMLSVGGSVFFRPKEKKVHADNAHKNLHRPGGDHLTLINVFYEWQETGFRGQWCDENFIDQRSMKKARDIKDQLTELCKRVEIDVVDKAFSIFEDDMGTNVRKAITAGFFYNTSLLQKSGNYRTCKNSHSVKLHPSSTLAEVLPKWVIYHELVFTSSEYMRQVIEVDKEWLMEIAPHYYKEADLKEEPQEPERKIPAIAEHVKQRRKH